MEFASIREQYDSYVECVTRLGGCLVVQRNVQILMDQGIIQVSHTETSKDMSIIGPHFELPTPVEIEYQRVPKSQQGGSQMSSVVVIKPAPFPYTSTKAVPWNYNETIFMNG